MTNLSTQIAEAPAIPTMDTKAAVRMIKLAEALDMPADTVKGFQDFSGDAEKFNTYAKAIAKHFEDMLKDGLSIPATVTDGVIKHSWHDRLSTDIALGRTIAIRGPAGNGKSTGVKSVLEGAGYNIYHLDCTDSTTVEMLVGGLQPKPDGKGALTMAFVPGLVNKAFNDPKGAIHLDEFDALDSRITMALQSALHRGKGKDPKRWLSSPDHKKGGEMSKGDCPIVVTMNTWGSGATREYVGRNSIDAASIDRFNTVLDTTYELEEDILVANGSTQSVAKNIVNNANKIREYVEKEGFKVVLSTRRLLDVAEAMNVLCVTGQDAWQRDFYSRIEPDMANKIKDSLKG